MATMKIKKGDMVKVIAGKDKDKEGKVIAVNTKNNTVLVEGINMVTKHAKPSMANQQGGIIHQEGPVDISNVMYLHKGTATRVGFKMDGDKKVRFANAHVYNDLIELRHFHDIFISKFFDHSIYDLILVLFFKSAQLFCLLSSINRSLRLFSLRNVLFYLHPS